MKEIDIRQSDVLDDIKTYKDFTFNTIFCDPPYNLSTNWYIAKDGSYQVKGNVADFMRKWNGIGGKELEIFFKESYRILKYGGYAILFSIDRQQDAFMYYARKAGFEVCQSLAWYFLQGFPKAVDIKQGVNRRLGLEKNHTSTLAKTFDGYKSGIAPFKPCFETILVFRRPCKNNSVLSDIMAFQEDKEISPAVVNIDGGRVPLVSGEDLSVERDGSSIDTRNVGWGFKRISRDNKCRFPSQIFIDDHCSELIDKQSGTKKSTGGKSGHIDAYSGGYKEEYYGDVNPGYGDIGGCSKILHKCLYEDGETEIVYYNPKSSPSEREKGIKNDVSNNHPTVKPISLITKIATLFKQPDICNQKWYVPFAGVFSEVIGIHKAGVPIENITACEVNSEYIEIGKSRLNYWRYKENKQMQIEQISMKFHD